MIHFILSLFYFISLWRSNNQPKLLEIFKALKNSWQTIIFSHRHKSFYEFLKAIICFPPNFFVVFRFYFLLFHIVSKAGIYFFNSAGSVGYRCFFLFFYTKQKNTIDDEPSSNFDGNYFWFFALGKNMNSLFFPTFCFVVRYTEWKMIDDDDGNRVLFWVSEIDHTCFRGERPAL